MGKALTVFGEDVQGFDTRDHREGVSGKRPRLVHGPGGGDDFHDLAPTTVRAHGKPTADDLAHRGEVGGDPPVFLRAPFADPEPGHDFVER